MTFQRAWTMGSEWARANPNCTREQFDARVATFTNAWGGSFGYRFRAAVLCVLRVVRNG